MHAVSVLSKQEKSMAFSENTAAGNLPAAVAIGVLTPVAAALVNADGYRRINGSTRILLASLTSWTLNWPFVIPPSSSRTLMSTVYCPATV